MSGTRRSASGQSAQAEKINVKPKLPPDLWANVAAHAVAPFFKEPIAVGRNWGDYYPIRIRETRVKERENKENIECISATCKVFHSEVKKLLRVDHLVVLKRFWNKVIDEARVAGNPGGISKYGFEYDEDDDPVVAKLSTDFHRLWYGTPKGICVMVHRGPDLLTMQCGQKEHEGPKICLHITDAYMQGASVSDVKITDEVIRVTHASLNDGVEEWLMQQCSFYLQSNSFFSPSTDVNKIADELKTVTASAKWIWDYENGIGNSKTITLWELVQWNREKTKIGPWVSQLKHWYMPRENQWHINAQSHLISKIMAGDSIDQSICVNIIHNGKAVLMCGSEMMRVILAFFQDEIKVNYWYPGQMPSSVGSKYCEYSKLSSNVKRICKAVTVEIHVFDNLSPIHAKNYVKLYRDNGPSTVG